MKVKELREALAALPDGYDEHDVQLVTDRRLFADANYDRNVMVASAPLVRISSPDASSVKHKRVWLYAEDFGASVTPLPCQSDVKVSGKGS
jgi:hypothetical protein